MPSGRWHPLLRSAFVAAAWLLLTSSAGGAPFAFVPSSGSPQLTVIDTATDTVAATVPLGAPATGVAIDRTGQRVYIAGGGFLTIIDAATHTVVATTPIEHAFGVAIDPAGTRAYVTREFGGTVSRPVVVVDTASATVIGTISMGNTNLSTSGIAIDATGGTLFVSSMDGVSGGAVTLIDARTDTRIGGIGFIFIWPVGVTLSPDGSKLYVACRGTGAARDHYRATLVIDVATRQITGWLSTITDPIGARGVPPYAVAVHPAGQRVYVTSDDGLWSFDVATNALVARAPGANLRGVAVHPDGTRVYAADYGSSSVNVYDAATLRLVASVHVGSAPIALGMFIGPPASPPPPPQALAPSEVPTMSSMLLFATALLVGLLGFGALSIRGVSHGLGRRR